MTGYKCIQGFDYLGVRSMLKKLNAAVAALLVAVCLMGALSVPVSAEQQLRVTASWLRLRSGPGTGYPILTRYKQGTLVTVLTTKKDKHWYYVRTAKGKTGWMAKEYLTTPDETKPADKKMSGMAVASRKVTFRTGPGKKYNVIKLLPKGQSMVIVGKTGAWYKVVVGKQSGYVMKTHVKLN